MARVVGAEPEIDLALLKIDAVDLPALALSKREVRPGQLVFAVGSPVGLANSVTLGVVSSVARTPDPSRPQVFIQTDAPINPGNSGGPLIDTEGNVVGINTSIVTRGGGSEGLGFAIPSTVVRVVTDSLRRLGRLQHVVLGISSQEITPGLAAGLALPQDWGVMVASPRGTSCGRWTAGPSTECRRSTSPSTCTKRARRWRSPSSAARRPSRWR